MDFSHAEIATPTTSCAACKVTLDHEYYVAGGAIVCQACARLVAAGVPPEGRVGRVLGALALGTLFGLGGAIVYALVLVLTNVQAALLTILVGWLVGTGVKKGSGGTGGTGYQVMSAVLTYVLCMWAFIPMMVQELGEGGDPVPIPVAVILSIPYALVLPFTGSLSILGIAILAFGIWQGFKIPAYVEIDTSGPYTIKPEAKLTETTEQTFFEGGGGDVLEQAGAPEQAAAPEAAKPSDDAETAHPARA